jgi:hypothetical protein
MNFFAFFKENSYLKTIEGCYFNYAFRSIKLPERFNWLIPENILVSAADKVGGIDVTARDYAIGEQTR